MIRIGILGSGSGTNFAAIADAVQAGTLTNTRIAIVLSDVEHAKILERAVAYKIPSQFLSANDYRTKLEGPQEETYIRALQSARVDYVVLAGFMRILKQKFLTAFKGRIVNIHPALLPAFPGLEAWKQALNHGVKITGCTVHFVDAGVDSGPIIAQESVPVHNNDTPETLHARIQEHEHTLYPRVVQWLADGRVTVSGRTVTIL